MKVMPRSEYKWKAFKMKWLIPNWGRAVGPAFWICKAKMWWDYEMDTSNYCSKISHFIRWLNEDVKRWLTPWLRNARKFKHICIECNGTKLLENDAMMFYIRTRDANQYYFLGKVNLLGKFTIIRRQWVQPDNTPINCFLFGITHAFSKDPEAAEEEAKNLILKEEVVFTDFVLTKAQLLKSIQKIESRDDFGWDASDIFIEKLAIQLKLKDSWKFKTAIYRHILQTYFPYAQYIYDLKEKDHKSFDEKILELNLDIAKRLAKENIYEGM